MEHFHGTALGIVGAKSNLLPEVRFGDGQMIAERTWKQEGKHWSPVRGPQGRGEDKKSTLPTGELKGEQLPKDPSVGWVEV